MKKSGNKFYRQFSASSRNAFAAFTPGEITATALRHYLTLDLIARGAGQAVEFLTLAEMLNLTAVLAQMGYDAEHAAQFARAQQAFAACIEHAVETGTWTIDQAAYAHLCWAIDAHHRQIATVSTADIVAAQGRIARHLALEQELAEAELPELQSA